MQIQKKVQSGCSFRKPCMEKSWYGKSRRWHAVRSSPAGIRPSGYGTSASAAEEKEHKKEEQQQMQQDYPEIVTKLQLLLSTGMNLRKSVERIAGDYVSYMRREEVRKAYEILVEVCGEMERGLGEKEAYEQLGERWGLLSYRTLSSILVQCLQKGSVGVEQILAKEAEQAQRLRRQQAQILGEQASTRLLFPMILMLLVVFVILLVPAWLTFAV